MGAQLSRNLVLQFPDSRRCARVQCELAIKHGFSPIIAPVQNHELNCDIADLFTFKKCAMWLNIYALFLANLYHLGQYSYEPLDSRSVILILCETRKN